MRSAEALRNSNRTKRTLETALGEDPQNGELRRQYFDELIRFSRCHVGLAMAFLPELHHPLYFRCGTSDILNMAQIFLLDEYKFEFMITPDRILDLGGYVGYATVFLTTRFPGAEILVVEPSSANFRLLQMNTLPYSRVNTVNAGVWDRSGRISVVGRDAGDWGNMFEESTDGSGMACYSVPDLMTMRGWASIDLLKCDIEGSEIRVFSDPSASWLSSIRMLAIETHDRLLPGCKTAVEACFPLMTYDRSQSGELELFVRRDGQQKGEHPTPISLLHADADLQSLETRHLANETWAFYIYDSSCCQLHPNPVGSAPAEIVLTRALQGQTIFSAHTSINNSQSQAIEFGLAIRNVETEVVMFYSSRVVFPGDHTEWTTELPPLFGTFQIVLQVQMAAGTTSNGWAWAQWKHPSLR